MNHFLKKAERHARDLTTGYELSTSTSTVAQMVQTGLSHHREGRHHIAEEIYSSVLAEDPENQDAMHLLGALRIHYTDFEGAIEILERLTAINPHFAEAWSNYGAALQGIGQADDAVNAFQKALELNANFPDAHYNLANTYTKLKEWETAIVHYRRAASLDPTHTHAYSNMAMAYHELGQYDEAMAACHSAILIDKRNVKAYNTLGLALHALGQVKEAAETFRAAIKLDPAYASAYGNLGRAFLHLKQPAAALEACIQAVQLNDSLAPAHCNRAEALRNLGRLDEAMQACQRAITIDPEFAEGHNILGNTYLDSSLIDEAINEYKKAAESSAQAREFFSNVVFAQQHALISSAEAVKEEAVRYGKRFGKDVFPPKPKPQKIRRIGFISGDLREHPVGTFVEALFANLDQEKYEIFAYANSGARDQQGEILSEFCKEWRQIIGLDDDTVAGMIEADRIDVLVDLAGHTGGNNLGVFTRNPAPIQVTWLGFSGTTGLPQMHAIIGDYDVTPESQDHLYTEKVVRLDTPWLCFTPPRLDVEVEGLPSRAGEPFTFGVFNHTRKINKESVEVWSQILNRIPGSRIMIKGKALASGALRRQYLAWFKNHGIDSSRVVFRQNTTWQMHFASFNQVDVCLDTWPYNGATTTAESLWMGVPVVTIEGHGHHALMSTSILRSVGLGEFVTQSIEDYIEKAVAMAQSQDRLQKWRDSLRGQLLTSPLCDGKKFAEAFADALESLK